MKITFISDTHGKHRELDGQLPGGDVLVHCGDISNVGALDEIEYFLRWFERQKYDHIIFIAGNHDFGFDVADHNQRVQDMLDEYMVTYLQDSSVTIDGIKFYGSPWTPEFNNWAFNMKPDELEMKWTSIPDDTDVLITHGPPKGILDMTKEGLSVGDPALLQALSRVQPRIHAFGHIHEASGMYEADNGSILINASSANRDYQIVNAPIIISI